MSETCMFCGVVMGSFHACGTTVRSDELFNHPSVKTGEKLCEQLFEIQALKRQLEEARGLVQHMLDDWEAFAVIVEDTEAEVRAWLSSTRGGGEG